MKPAPTTAARPKSEPATVRFFAWVQLARLQFYALSLSVLTAGAFAAHVALGQPWQLSALALTALCLVLVEFLTVLSNELHDLPADRLNAHAGPFNGGSRVLVRGVLGENDVRRARRLAGVALIGAAAWLWHLLPRPLEMAGLGAVGLALGLAYSIPPARLSARGLGEVTVGCTHSFLTLLAGYLSQDGALGDARPWLLALPLFFAVLPSILIAGIPDREADGATGKRTIAVRWGNSATSWLALVSTLAAFALLLLRLRGGVAASIFAGLLFTHVAFLSIMLIAYLSAGSPGRRQDRLLIASLSYMLWFPAAIFSRVVLL